MRNIFHKIVLKGAGFAVLAVAIVALFIVLFSFSQVRMNTQFAAVAVAVQSPFHYAFKVDGVLDEAGRMNESWSPYWWLNSGGKFFLQDGIGMTIQGELPQFSKWRVYYAATNGRDTDNGYHPQNIFRLLTRSTWRNIDQRVKFQITKINMSESIERGGWSGVLLFNRYIDGDNLYYAGIRMDGHAVIKKKIGGRYYTLAYEPVYSTSDLVYERDTNPNLIPGKQWIGLRSVVLDQNNGQVEIQVYLDKENNGGWQLVAEAVDDGQTYGPAFRQNGYAGIRTDYMDVRFNDYVAVEH